MFMCKMTYSNITIFHNNLSFEEVQKYLFNGCLITLSISTKLLFYFATGAIEMNIED